MALDSGERIPIPIQPLGDNFALQRIGRIAGNYKGQRENPLFPGFQGPIAIHIAAHISRLPSRAVADLHIVERRVVTG